MFFSSNIFYPNITNMQSFEIAKLRPALWHGMLSHNCMGVSMSPGCFSSNRAPCYWLGKSSGTWPRYLCPCHACEMCSGPTQPWPLRPLGIDSADHRFFSPSLSEKKMCNIKIKILTHAIIHNMTLPNLNFLTQKITTSFKDYH